jgi:hypothetical protein
VNDIYCSYFDHNYLPRALLTIRSLRLYDTATPIYILTLSDLCETVLRELALPNVRIIPLRTLEEAYPELVAVKPTRSRIEYYFTLTPFLPHYLFAATPAERVTYIDMDLYFFSSPKPVLHSLGQASVAITPHRFSFEYRNHFVYGLFNVAWLTFRRCAEGLDCLNSYKADCTAWCYDRLEDGRFGDQKYLDSWPQRYPSLRAIEHKGVNLASWNIDNYELKLKNQKLTVDADPVVFYHFSGTIMRPDGSMEVSVPSRPGPSKNVMIRHIVKPYVRKLETQRANLHQRFPALAAAEAEIRYSAAAAAVARSTAAGA